MRCSELETKAREVGSNDQPTPKGGVTESQQWFDNVLLSRPMSNLIYKTFAMKKRLPSRSGRTVRMRRYNNLNTATVPLPASGLTPPPQPVTAVDIDATIDFYGDYTLITDQVTFVNQDPKRYGVFKPSLIDLEAYELAA